MANPSGLQIEEERLQRDADRKENWKRWGPYLSERQWGTVREDYSGDGSNWTYFTHDHARSRVYRWGEDGLMGITDRECRLCFALALWNGKDPILKERLFGLGGPEGNHGEDVKECYYYLDSLPTHAYMKGLYKYPQNEFPYRRLIEENARQGKDQPEFEIIDTGVFDKNEYFDVTVEYAKAAADDILIQITAANRGPAAATIHLLPTLWFRNTWVWGRTGEGYWPRRQMTLTPEGAVLADHPSLGKYLFHADTGPARRRPNMLFTENETNNERLYGGDNLHPWVKDGFHDHVIHKKKDAVNPKQTGTKAAAHYVCEIAAGKSVEIRLRLTRQAETAKAPFGKGFDETLSTRRKECDEYYAAKTPKELDPEAAAVYRQAYAGILWGKQFFHYIVHDWLDGDPAMPAPPRDRWTGRNHEWMQLYNRDVISMPDKWEYPWYAAWDTAFHMIPFASIDPHFSKEQLVLFLREWYMHANGQIPAYEFAFSDVNPPVHAWACWRIYKMTGAKGQRDRTFLSRTFLKLMLNFTWWVNRKDAEGNNLFSGGFLGLDNIGVFDRSKPLPTGGHLQQADGTAWMAFYAATMMSMACELALTNPAMEDIASKFFEHFIAIADSINTLGGTGLWDEKDGFYYDQLRIEGKQIPLRCRSMVGLVPLFTCEILEQDDIERLPGFRKRLEWFLENRKDLASQMAYFDSMKTGTKIRRLLAIPSRERLERVLRYLLDEDEFLSPYGIRSMSRVYKDHPYVFRIDGHEWKVAYDPADSSTGLFGGNSNWRGPVWFPMNYLIIEALERFHHFYGDSLKVECPVGSGRKMNLREVAREISKRLGRLFLPDKNGRRPCHGNETPYAKDPHWKNLALFYEYFDGDTGRGIGASHQTGWTSLVTRCLRDAYSKA
ncbi:glucosidase [bacterium]|nr:glucosidase [bacterium]